MNLQRWVTQVPTKAEILVMACTSYVIIVR